MKRYAIVGTGGRHAMYRNAIVERFNNRAALVGLLDTNPGRLELAATRAGSYVERVETFDASSVEAAAFDAMVEETSPDVVIVTSMDSTHDRYICRALERGCDVITEKPLTTDADKLQRILDTCAATSRHVTVTFNYRYSSVRAQLKKLLLTGAIGEVTAVDFQWMLDTRHGADYFRRWHRNKANSGGLLVHKATHHFDLVNWWLADVPEEVSAVGERNYYRPAQAAAIGLAEPGKGARDVPSPRSARSTSTSTAMKRWLSSTATTKATTAIFVIAAFSPMRSTSRTRCTCGCATHAARGSTTH